MHDIFDYLALTPSVWQLNSWSLPIVILTATSLVLLGACTVDKSLPTISRFTPEVASNRSGKPILILLALLALSLRLWNIDFGLPEFFHPDEPVKAQVVLQMLTSHSLDPHYFKHPSFLLYASYFGCRILELLLEITPTTATCILVGRLTSAVLGSLSIPLLYLIAAPYFGRWTATVSSALFAVAPLHVVCSRYFKEDAALLFFLLLTAYFSLASLRRRSGWLLLVAGLSAGFSASTKYSGALGLFLLLPPVLASLLPFLPQLERLTHIRSPLLRSEARTLAWAIAIIPIFFIIGFLLITPYAALNFTELSRDFLFEKKHMLVGHSGGTISPWKQWWTFHLSRSIPPALTWPIAVLSLLGIGVAVRRRGSADIACLLLFLLYYLPAEWVRAKPAPQPERYILPLIPVLLIFASQALCSFIRQASSTNSSRTSILSLTTSPWLFLFFFPMIFVIRHSSSLSDDTREQAGFAVMALSPSSESPLVVDFKNYGPAAIEPNRMFVELAPQPKILGSLTMDKLRVIFPNSALLALSNFYTDRFLFYPNDNHSKSEKRLRKFVNKNIPLRVVEAPAVRYGFHNPSISIYRIN